MYKINKPFIISYVIVTILTIVGFVLLIYFDVLKRKPQDMQKSYDSGYGYYSDPILDPCLTNSGGCGERGSQDIIKKCIVHPVTGKGCVLPDGTMSYDDIVTTVGCRKQCINSAFETSDGLQFKEVKDNQGNLFTIITGAGGNRIINKFGIDYTEEYLGDFNEPQGNYQLKKCFDNSDYFAYSTKTFNCNQVDGEKGANNCLFVCGSDDRGTLKMNTDSSNAFDQQIPQYPKVDGRYLCQDIYGNNQIEIFNNGAVPDDFVYPNFCYQHFDKPGVSKVFIREDNINNKQTFFTINDDSFDEYDIIKDYNFYHPLKIDHQNSIVERLIKTNLNAYQNSDDTGYLYLDMQTKIIKPQGGIKLAGITYNDIYSLGQGDYNIIAIPLDKIVDSNSIFSDYYYQNGKMILKYKGGAPSEGTSIYYRINSYNVEHYANIKAISNIDPGTSSFEVDILDLGNNAYDYGIRFWYTNSLFEAQIENGPLTIKNRIDNAKYFLSDLQIMNPFNIDNTVEENIIRPFSNNQLINLEYQAYTDEIFYLYSNSRKRFYYPVSRSSSSYSDTYKFNLENDYPGIDFYLLKDGLSDVFQPPNSNLNLYSYEYLNGCLQAETVTANYGTSFNGYIKQLKLLTTATTQNLSSDKIDATLGDYNSYYTLISLRVAPSANQQTIVKRMANLAQDVDSQAIEDSSPYIDKMKLYNTIIDDTYNFYNLFGNPYQISIQALRATVLQADYTVFRSPILERTGEKICFDQFNRPKANGTKINLNPGDKVILYKQNTLNTEDHLCGYYGLSGAIKDEQYREDKNPIFDLEPLMEDSISYHNFDNFARAGYKLEDLYCFKNPDSNNNQVFQDKYCLQPFTTRNYQENYYYNPEEDLIEDFNNNNLYSSLNNNNLQNPLDSQSWRKVINYQNSQYLNQNERVYINNKDDDYYLVYDTNQNGFAGEEIDKIAVYYLYNKQYPIFQGASTNSVNPNYFLNRKYYQNNYLPKAYSQLTPNEKQTYLTQPKEICNLNDNNFIYQFGISIGSQTGSSIYNIRYSLTTPYNLEENDLINPDFNLFNSVLIADGISVFNLDKNKAFDLLNDYNQKTINYEHINNFAKIDDLIFIAYDKNYDILEYLEVNKDLYNYSFEVCRITKIDQGSSTVTLDRNLLNYPAQNIFLDSGVSPTAYLLDKDLPLDLVFRGVSTVSNNIINFDFLAYFNNPPSILEITKNCQSRTAISARIIKNNIEIPNNSLPNSTNRLILFSSPQENKVSAYLDLMVKQDLGNGIFVYYFNQFREDNYSSNKQENTFEIGDILNLTFDNDITYQLEISNRKIFFNNRLFDYFATSATDIKEVNDGIQYFNFTNSLPNYQSSLLETLNYQYPTQLSIREDTTNSLINPSKFTNQYYQNLPDSLTSVYYYNSFRNLFQNQSQLDRAVNQIALMELKSTRLYNDLSNLNSYLVIDNIKCNHKPYGPTYLRKLATSNDLNYDGYGTITDFDVTSNFLTVNNLEPPLILKSLSGFTFIVQSQAAQLIFNSLHKNTPQNYQNISYQKNQLAFFERNNSLIYSNVGSSLALFNQGKADYNQAYYYYNSDTSKYNYPLFLQKTTSGNSIKVNDIPLYYTGDTLPNYDNKPTEREYKNFVFQEAIQSQEFWKQVPESSYPISDVLNYDINHYYLSGDNVFFNNNVWTALKDNSNSQPDFDNTNWQIFDNYSDLYNTNGFFFNINSGTSTIINGLSVAGKLDIDNYPISINDYGNQKYYGILPVIKGISDYQDRLADSFLNIPFFQKQLPILAKVIYFKKSNGNLISLAASPTTEENIDNYGMLRQFDNLSSGDILSQYLYDLDLPDKNFTGKFYCQGQTPFNSNVSNYDFANSVAFITTPVDLKYQDYPSINYKTGVSLYDMPPGALYNHPGISSISIIENNSGTYSYKSLNFKRSYLTSINDNDHNNFSQGQAVGGNGDTFNFSFPTDNLQWNIQGPQPLPNSIDSQTIILNNSSWYAKDKGDKVISYGNFNFGSSNINYSQLKLTEDVLIVYVDGDNFNTQEGLSANFIFNQGLSIPNVNFRKINSSFNLVSTPTNKADQIYTFTETKSGNNNGLSAYLSLDDNNDFIAFNKIYIPDQSLQDGVSIFFTPVGISSLKTKLYGFFENLYLAPITYQTENLIISSQESIPNLIINQDRNQLLNPVKSDTRLIDSDNKKVIITQIPDNQICDVFNLSNENDNLFLRTNNYKYPIFDGNKINQNNIFFDNLVNDQGENKIPGVINTNSTVNFISEGISMNDLVILGGISQIIPLEGENSSKNQYYRETKGGLVTNLDSFLNCSIFVGDQESNKYPVGQNIDCFINNRELYNITNFGLSQILYNAQIPKLIYNTSAVFDQDEPSNQNMPIYISTKSGQEFKDNLIFNTDEGTSSKSLVQFFFNGFGVSSDVYYNLNSTKNFNNMRTRKIELTIAKNNFFEEIEEQTLYLGTSNIFTGAQQFTSGISTITFKNF